MNFSLLLLVWMQMSLLANETNRNHSIVGNRKESAPVVVSWDITFPFWRLAKSRMPVCESGFSHTQSSGYF